MNLIIILFLIIGIIGVGVIIYVAMRSSTTTSSPTPESTSGTVTVNTINPEETINKMAFGSLPTNLTPPDTFDLSLILLSDSPLSPSTTIPPDITQGSGDGLFGVSGFTTAFGFAPPQNAVWLNAGQFLIGLTETTLYTLSKSTSFIYILDDPVSAGTGNILLTSFTETLGTPNVINIESTPSPVLRSTLAPDGSGIGIDSDRFGWTFDLTSLNIDSTKVLTFVFDA